MSQHVDSSMAGNTDDPSADFASPKLVRFGVFPNSEEDVLGNFFCSFLVINRVQRNAVYQTTIAIV
jgi:hypothetical protein